MHVEDDDNFADGGSQRVSDLALFDYHDIGNALQDGPAKDATASYRLRWDEDGDPLTIDDGSNFHFSGRATGATAEWTAQVEGTRVRSNTTTHVNFALIGRERNGAFYGSDGD